jgi:choline dehydrogenase
MDASVKWLGANYPTAQIMFFRCSVALAPVLVIILLRHLASAPALAEIIDHEIRPGPSVQSDDELITDIRQRADTVYHPSCTCMMGPDPKTAVVDSKCRVYGVDKLRVVDTSVFPTVTSGNTNGPTIMVAEKAADLILA